MRVSFKSITPIILPDYDLAERLDYSLQRNIRESRYILNDQTDSYQKQDPKDQIGKQAELGNKILLFLTGLELQKYNQAEPGFIIIQSLLDKVDKAPVVVDDDLSLYKAVNKLKLRVKDENGAYIKYAFEHLFAKSDA